MYGHMDSDFSFSLVVNLDAHLASSASSADNITLGLTTLSRQIRFPDD
jgi:hypothetical protein